MYSVSQGGQRNWEHRKWKRGDRGDRMATESKLKALVMSVVWPWTRLQETVLLRGSSVVSLLWQTQSSSSF